MANTEDTINKYLNKKDNNTVTTLRIIQMIIKIREQNIKKMISITNLIIIIEMEIVIIIIAIIKTI